MGAASPSASKPGTGAVPVSSFSSSGRPSTKTVTPWDARTVTADSSCTLGQAVHPSPSGKSRNSARPPSSSTTT